MGDLISRSALIDWVEKQREEVTKKQVAGTKDSIFTREALTTMKICLSTFERKVNKMPTAYDVEKVVAELEDMMPFCPTNSLDERTEQVLLDAIDIVRKGGVE